MINMVKNAGVEYLVAGFTDEGSANDFAFRFGKNVRESLLASGKDPWEFQIRQEYLFGLADDGKGVTSVLNIFNHPEFLFSDLLAKAIDDWKTRQRSNMVMLDCAHIHPEDIALVQVDGFKKDHESAYSFITQLHENAKKLDGPIPDDLTRKGLWYASLDQTVNYGEIKLTAIIAKDEMVAVVENLILEWNSRRDFSLSFSKLIVTPQQRDLSDFRNFNITEH